jgi:hypothetical protein
VFFNILLRRRDIAGKAKITIFRRRPRPVSGALTLPPACKRDVGLKSLSLGAQWLHRSQTMLVIKRVRCPYCGETFETHIDTSAGSQEYIEDCYVCCRPITFRGIVGPDGNLIECQVYRDDD